MIQLTQLSITFLAQLILLLLCIAYLIYQRNFRSPGWIMVCLCVAGALVAFNQFIAVSLPHQSPIAGYIAPLHFVPASLCTVALIQFNYRFPVNSHRFKIESYIVLAITGLITLAIAAIVVLMPFQISPIRIRLAPVFIVTQFFWALFVTVRNYFVHLRQSDQTFPHSIRNPASQITRAFNFYLLILMIPFGIVGFGFPIRLRIMPPVIADSVIVTLSLLLIYFMVGIYLNRSWQRTSFLSQLLASIIVTQLILISIAALIFAPEFSRSYMNDQLLAEEQNIVFTPTQNGYTVEKTELNFSNDLGEKIDLLEDGSVRFELPFSFPYFENSYGEIFISDNRIVTFDKPFDFVAIRDGMQSGIGVMAMDIGMLAPNLTEESGVYLQTTAESATITWYLLPLIAPRPDPPLETAQLVLYADGTVDMAFVSHPQRGEYSIRPLNSPWLIGLQNGQFNARPHQVNFAEGLAFETADNHGIIQDYHIPYRQHLHRSLRPMIALLAIGLILTLGAFPLFIGFNIVQPVNSLVEGIDEVNRGNLNVALRVRRNDEIGYLTDSFNRMVGSIREKNAELNENSNLLETRVRQRTSLLAEMTQQAEKARKEAIEANQTKSAFIANITHEIRTPLNAIIGFADILREDVHDIGRFEWEGDLVRIRNSATDLLNMINEILDISKIEAGRTSFYYEEFNLQNMAAEIIDFLAFILQENNNRASFVVNTADTMLLGDYMKVRQILQNLMSNAAKFTDDGIIQLFIDRITEKNQYFYLIQVRDTGIGMTEEQLSRVFEPFQQADNSTTRNYGGSGLGLAISKQYAEMMGGRLWAESRIGIGSTFYLALPLKPPSSIEIARRIKENGTLIV